MAGCKQNTYLKLTAWLGRHAALAHHASDALIHCSGDKPYPSQLWHSHQWLWSNHKPLVPLRQQCYMQHVGASSTCTFLASVWAYSMHCAGHLIQLSAASNAWDDLTTFRGRTGICFSRQLQYISHGPQQLSLKRALYYQHASKTDAACYCGVKTS